MSEMVERVALALRESVPGLVNPEAWPWELMARAAITAMREPTSAMHVRQKRSPSRTAPIASGPG